MSCDKELFYRKMKKNYNILFDYILLVYLLSDN
jgi:hypothetical protein